MDQPNHTILIYSMFYGTTNVPSRDLNSISGINREEVLRFLIKIKIAVSRPGSRNVDHPFILQLMAILPPLKGRRLFAMLSDRATGDFLTHPIVINLIITDILNEPFLDIEPGVPLPAQFAAMIDLLLIYNEHHFRTILIGRRPDDHDLLWEMMLMQNINPISHAAYVRNGIGKQLVFLEFLKYKLGDRFGEFEKQVADLLGIHRLLEIPDLFVRIHIQQDRLDGSANPVIVVQPDNPLYPIFEHIGLVIDVKDKNNRYGVEAIVMHCFLKFSDEKLYLMGTNDFGLITDKGWQYFLFSKGDLAKFVPGLKNQNQFFSWIGKEYIENFLMAKLFLSLNKTGFRVLLSDDKKTPDVTIIQNETDVFLIEIKSYALNYRVWKDQDLALLKQHLHEKYLSDKTGVIQLQKCLANLAADPGGLFNIHQPLTKLKIYPIIIYADPHLMSMAVNDYVITHSPVLEDSLQKKFQSILPVTMIHFDFFLENLEVIRSNKKILKDAIVRYHKNIKTRKGAWKKFRSTLNFERAMISFDHHSAGFQRLYELDQKKILASILKVFRTDK